MEGTQGPNIAQIASMQQHAAQEESENLNFLNNLFPVKAFGIDYIEASGGNLGQLFSSFLNQSMMMGGISSFLGQKPWSGFFGINVLGKQAMFNINSGAEEILGHDDSQMLPEYEAPTINDPGMDMVNAGMEYGGDIPISSYQPPPDQTPPMDVGQGAGMEMGG
ncbi:MAG: hypothetical protein HRK26_02665 [Rickettsiaceae bacterium H1]|nr:hypothetical protein [Rickettsiaceae bacterium H1]